VLLTFGNDRGVEMILRCARERGTDFRVVVVDTRLGLDGQTLVRDLDAAGVACTYVHFNGLDGIMSEVTKVILGCDTCLANGSVKAPSGTALVAMAAHDRGVPVLVICESYRFSDKTLFDSITHNELANPDNLARTPHSTESGVSLADWRSLPNIKLLNLVYDITPINFVTVVVTELGLLPPTSIPVIIREYGAEGKV
jgi:translation initiation factor eIF-2B subunit delta